MLAALALAAVLTTGPQTAPQAAPPAHPAPTALAGAEPSPDCGGMRELIGGADARMQCVTAPMERVGDLALAFASEARRNGWAPVGGTPNALWMQKPAADGQCERMTIIGFWDFRLHPEPLAGVPGYVGVLLQPNQACQTLPPASATPPPPTAQ